MASKRINRKVLQANCTHDFFKGIASQFCLKCGKVEPTAEFLAKGVIRVEAGSRG